MSSRPEIIDVRDAAAAAAGVAAGIACLRGGGCVAIPTESAYSIAVALDADRARAIERELERAQWYAAASFHADRDSALRALPVITPAARRLAKRYLPGPLVLVAHDESSSRRGAVRVPGVAASRDLLRGSALSLLVHEPWSLDAVAPDASTATAAASVAARFPGIVDLVLDGGVTQLAEPPAVVRADTGDLAVLRSGILSARDLMKTARRNVLFVCAGNTCRSPMAAALLVRALAQKLDISPRSVANAGFGVASAGAYAAPGMPASRGAKHAMVRYEIGLAAHRSTPLDLELLSTQDRVFALTGSILEDLRSTGITGPRLEHIRRGPDPRDVRDPYGGDDAVYDACAAELETIVDTIADELIADG